MKVKEITNFKKNTLWMEVCREINIHNMGRVKKRWDHLRSKYMETRTAKFTQCPSVAAAKKKIPTKEFKFYDSMHFLKKSVDPVS